MLFQFLSRHICRIVVVEMMIYAGDVLYVIEHFGYIMAYDDDGALPVDLPQYNHLDKQFPISVYEVVLSGLSKTKSLFSRYTQAQHQQVLAAVVRRSRLRYGGLSTP